MCGRRRRLRRAARGRKRRRRPRSVVVCSLTSIAHSLSNKVRARFPGAGGAPRRAAPPRPGAAAALVLPSLRLHGDRGLAPGRFTAWTGQPASGGSLPNPILRISDDALAHWPCFMVGGLPVPWFGRSRSKYEGYLVLFCLRLAGGTAVLWVAGVVTDYCLSAPLPLDKQQAYLNLHTAKHPGGPQCADSVPGPAEAITHARPPVATTTDALLLAQPLCWHSARAFCWLGEQRARRRAGRGATPQCMPCINCGAWPHGMATGPSSAPPVRPRFPL